MRTTHPSQIISAILLRLRHHAGLFIILLVGIIFLTPTHSAQAYSYLGHKWSNSQAGFYLDIAGWDPALIQGPASTWNNAGSPFRFKLLGNNVYKPGDRLNTVARYVINSPKLAITNYRWDGSGNLTEADTIFNMNYGWGCCGESDLYDVKNTMTHEFGHWLVLDDLYSWTWDRNKTMYASSVPGETKKRTLETDDINGINYIY